MGTEGRRRLGLRHKTNEELFALYDAEVILRHRNPRNLDTTRGVLAKLKEHLDGFAPSPELAKGFLVRYVDRAPTTLAKYASIVKGFMAWYGEPMSDFKVKVPRPLPSYTTDSDIDKVRSAIASKGTHKGLAMRDTLLFDLALLTGMRRGDLANLEVRDVFPDFLLVRKGKGNKDSIKPLPSGIAERLHGFTKDRRPEEKVFGLRPASISLKIKAFAKKEGVNGFHTHSLRHKFATDLLEQGRNLREVQQLLGHARLDTTQIYLAVTDMQLRHAVQSLEDHHLGRLSFSRTTQPIDLRKEPIFKGAPDKDDAPTIRFLADKLRRLEQDFIHLPIPSTTACRDADIERLGSRLLAISGPFMGVEEQSLG